MTQIDEHLAALGLLLHSIGPRRRSPPAGPLADLAPCRPARSGTSVGDAVIVRVLHNPGLQKSSKPHKVCSALPLTGGGPPGLGNHLRITSCSWGLPPPRRPCPPWPWSTSLSMSWPRSPPFRPNVLREWRPPQSELSLSGMSRIHGKVGLAPPRNSVCSLSDPPVICPRA